MPTHKLDVAKVNALMNDQGMNAKILASKVQSSEQSASLWIKGKTNPRYKKLVEISMALGVDLPDITVDSAPEPEQTKKPRAARKPKVTPDDGEEPKTLSQVWIEKTTKGFEVTISGPNLPTNLDKLIKESLK